MTIQTAREIVLDTETTGLDHRAGHRIIEIGCLELLNHIPTGQHFHQYIDPDRDIEEEAVAVHGLSRDKLVGKPRFGEIAPAFLDFIGEARLVIHNAEFDIGFLNAELALLGLAPLDPDRAICTVKLTRRRFPGSPANLDALCRRFGVDNSGRQFHGALLDAQLLAECYVELLGGRQHGLALATETVAAGMSVASEVVARTPRPHAATAAELEAHAAMLAEFKSPLWLES
jgi:DNA polymerase-3 subunit epsilon